MQVWKTKKMLTKPGRLSAVERPVVRHFFPPDVVEGVCWLWEDVAVGLVDEEMVSLAVLAPVTLEIEMAAVEGFEAHAFARHLWGLRAGGWRDIVCIAKPCYTLPRCNALPHDCT
jgi:hypothetical protein